MPLSEEEKNELIEKATEKLEKAAEKKISELSSNIQKKHEQWGDEVGKRRKEFEALVGELKESSSGISEGAVEKIYEKVLDKVQEGGVKSHSKDGGSKGSDGSPAVEEQIESLMDEMSDEELKRLDEELEKLDDKDRKAIENDPKAVLEALQGVHDSGSNSLLDRIKAKRSGASGDDEEESYALKKAREVFRKSNVKPTNERESDQRGPIHKKAEPKRRPNKGIPPSL